MVNIAQTTGRAWHQLAFCVIGSSVETNFTVKEDLTGTKHVKNKIAFSMILDFVLQEQYFLSFFCVMSYNRNVLLVAQLVNPNAQDKPLSLILNF